MAWTSGTATDYRDLLRRLRQFVTTDMLPATQRWQQLRWVDGTSTQELILKGPGLAGTDEIYVGIYSSQDTTANWYIWDLQGFTGYNPANPFSSQPNAIPGYNPKISLWNSAIPYWFVANGRRIVVVAKVSTVYEAAYLGLILPYGIPSQYPYPLLVGGSMTGEHGNNWSITTCNHRHFTDPGSGAYNNINATCMLRGPSGAWLNFRHWYYSGGDQQYSSSPRRVWPFFQDYLETFREATDGTYVLMPLVMLEYNSATDHNLFGEMDGCFYVSGFANAAENLISVGGVDHLVVQNVFRTTVRDYWALRLE